MDISTVKKTMVYQELSEENRQKWFGLTQKKFITHVDTFYYSVKTKGGWGDQLGARTLVQTLKKLKEDAAKENEPMPFMEDDVFSDLVIKPYFGFGMYRFGISKEDCFDIFVAENVPNGETNPIVVQLRSQFIWLSGLKNALYESLVYLYGVLARYDVEVSDITENRIDYAYHTNYIQDMLSFFKDENLGQMQVSSYKRWSKEGNFLGSIMYNDYISLGRRKSNSSFVRIYNKSKEVVELGYKQFFVPIWLENGLISEFDKFVFDQIFNNGQNSWNYKEIARCQFYLQYGREEGIKREIRQLLAFEDSPINAYKKLADLCVPDLTNVVNLEIQTKRKFYYNFVFEKMDYPKWVPVAEYRMYTILHKLKAIRAFITQHTIRFVKFKGQYREMRHDLRPVADWWARLSACGELDGVNGDLCRQYQKNYDLKRCKARNLTNLATLSTLLEEWDSEDVSFLDDISDICSHINDNDLVKYSRIRMRKRKELRKYQQEPLGFGSPIPDEFRDFKEQPDMYVFDEGGQMQYGNDGKAAL